jgi:predicted GNAT superfamily acetyltransferase
MAIAIRDVRENELDSVLALNNAAGATILPLDAGRVHDFFREAAYFRVAEADGHLAGFLIAAQTRNGRKPPVSRTLCRVPVHRPHVVAQRTRHRPAAVPCRCDEFAEVRVPLLACEVFLEPATTFRCCSTARMDSRKSASR